MNQLEALFSDISKTKQQKRISTKELIKLYGVTRRGWRVNEKVNIWLENYELAMEPDLEKANFYGSVDIYPKRKITLKGEIKTPKYTDIIPRLNIIKSSDLNNSETSNTLIYVRKETTLKEATTLMIFNNFSQLPILSSKRDAYGLISWNSIGKALALGKNCNLVIDCSEQVEILKYDDPLFKAVKIILEKEVVLVKDNKNEISGIITSTDIGEQFLILSEPFLLIEQIENFIRNLLDNRLTIDDVKKVIDIEKYEKEIKHLSDLSFGHYVKIFENENLFKKIDINIDRVILQKKLVKVNKIRNEIMHFSPEAIENEDLLELRKTQNFLQQIIENR